jgi:Pyridine nucleotide-disulphide oxidoreductase, dimerisation domain
MPDYTGVPSAVFTIPELTRIGLDEAEAREQRLEFKIKTNDMSDWYSVERVGESHAAAKVLLEKGGVACLVRRRRHSGGLLARHAIPGDPEPITQLSQFSHLQSRCRKRPSAATETAVPCPHSPDLSAGTGGREAARFVFGHHRLQR